MLQDPDLNIDFAGPIADSRFDDQKNYLGTLTKREVYNELTQYANLILLSDGEGHARVCLEAMAAGLGLVVSEQAAANLDLSLPFIDVIPNSKITDLEFIKRTIKKNREVSLSMREEIRSYCIKEFGWENIIKKYEKAMLSICLNNSTTSEKVKLSQINMPHEGAIEHAHGSDRGQIERLIDSIKDLGYNPKMFTSWIILDVEYRIVDGSHRTHALLELYGPDHEIEIRKMHMKKKSPFRLGSFYIPEKTSWMGDLQRREWTDSAKDVGQLLDESPLPREPSDPTGKKPPEWLELADENRRRQAKQFDTWPEWFRKLKE